MNSIAIDQTVEKVANNLTALSFYQKAIENLSIAAKLTKEYILSNRYRFSTVKEMEDESYIVFAGYWIMCTDKYWGYLSCWDEVITKTLNQLWCNPKSQLFLALYKGSNHSEEMVEKLKELMQDVFINKKVKYLGDNFYNEVLKYSGELRPSTSYTDISTQADRDEITDRAIRLFWLYCNPIHLWKKDKAESGKELDVSDLDKKGKELEPWQMFLYKRYHDCEKDFYKKTKNKPKTYGDTPIGEDGPGTIFDTIEAPEDSKPARLCDALRDLFVTNIRINNSNEKVKVYECFFTDNVSALINASDLIYLHIKRNLKLYDPVVNLNFLNFYVDFECLSIVDSIDKKRKPMSQFKEEEPYNNNECEQPLDECVFEKFLDCSYSTIHSRSNEYYRQIAKIFPIQLVKGKRKRTKSGGTITNS